ncbi:MAG: hypothetical protein NC114_06585 [Ruminococcus flavefaciens]|nr:hypothetical protein [Ruminococcus flavefaciens]
MEIKSNMFTFPKVPALVRKVTQSTHNEGLMEYRDKMDEFLETIGMTMDQTDELKYGFAIDIHVKGDSLPIRYRKTITGFGPMLDEIHEFYEKFDAVGQTILYKNHIISRKMLIHADIAIYILNDENEKDAGPNMDTDLLNNHLNDLIELADMKHALTFCHIMTDEEEAEMREHYAEDIKRRQEQIRRREVHLWDDFQFRREAMSAAHKTEEIKEPSPDKEEDE